MCKYFVRGTVSLEINKDDFFVWITPAQQFVTPDNENQRIVAFPLNVDGSTALIADLDLKAKRCHLSKKLKTALLTLSVQKSLVELHIIQKSPNWKIIGIKFPV